MSRNTSGGGRWDAERFMHESGARNGSPRRERGASVVVAERERERERDDKKRRSAVEDYLRSQDKYQAPARRPDRDYDDAHLTGESDALVPFEERRRRSPSPERPPTRSSARRTASRPPQPQPPPVRPTLLKRQSSLDTFHRAADRRAQDNRRSEREDNRPPVAPAAPRRRAPSQVGGRQDDLDEIRVAEPDYYGDERFRGVRERQPSAPPRGRRTPVQEQVVQEKVEQRPFPHRGKTRVPKRFVHPRAMIDLGYPYEDEVCRDVGFPENRKKRKKRKKKLLRPIH